VQLLEASSKPIPQRIAATSSEAAMSNALKNRLAISAIFLLFGLTVALLSIILRDDRLAYVLSAIIFALVAVFERIGKLTIFRGFAKFGLLIIIPSSAFPLAFMGRLPMPEITLWLAAFAMLAALPIIWWNVAKRSEE
jgi:hypothetical protein